jgi:flagellar assembly factor FliW
MKVEITLEEPPVAESFFFNLPQGLIGLAGYTRGQITPLPDNPPFLLLKLTGPTDSIYFIVIEPRGLIPDYEIELFDADAAALELTGSPDAVVLNIVTLNPRSPLNATVNLLGPIVVNRRTRNGRQLVIANNSRYSAKHPLIESGSLACA